MHKDKKDTVKFTKTQQKLFRSTNAIMSDNYLYRKAEAIYEKLNHISRVSKKAYK